MREKIIKLLLSSNDDDQKIGVEYLKKFYSHELFKKEDSLNILFPRDLNKILNTTEFLDNHSFRQKAGGFWDRCLIVFNDDWPFILPGDKVE